MGIRTSKLDAVVDWDSVEGNEPMAGGVLNLCSSVAGVLNPDDCASKRYSKVLCSVIVAQAGDCDTTDRWMFSHNLAARIHQGRKRSHGVPGGNRRRCSSAGSQPPFDPVLDKLLVLEDTLAPIEPSDHLRVFILAVCRTECIFGKINVQPLSIRRVVVVCGAEELDVRSVMTHRMELGEVEVSANFQINEDLFIGMEPVQRTLQHVQGVVGMQWVLSKLNKVENGADSPKQADI